MAYPHSGCNSLSFTSGTPFWHRQEMIIENICSYNLRDVGRSRTMSFRKHICSTPHRGYIVITLNDLLEVILLLFLAFLTRSFTLFLNFLYWGKKNSLFSFFSAIVSLMSLLSHGGIFGWFARLRFKRACLLATVRWILYHVAKALSGSVQFRTSVKGASAGHWKRQPY